MRVALMRGVINYHRHFAFAKGRSYVAWCIAQHAEIQERDKMPPWLLLPFILRLSVHWWLFVVSFVHMLLFGPRIWLLRPSWPHNAAACNMRSGG